MHVNKSNPIFNVVLSVAFTFVLGVLAYGCKSKANDSSLPKLLSEDAPEVYRIWVNHCYAEYSKRGKKPFELSGCVYTVNLTFPPLERLSGDDSIFLEKQFVKAYLLRNNYDGCEELSEDEVFISSLNLHLSSPVAKIRGWSIPHEQLDVQSEYEDWVYQQLQNVATNALTL